MQLSEAGMCKMSGNSSLVLAILVLFIAGTTCFDEDIVEEWPQIWKTLQEGERGRWNCTMRAGAVYKNTKWLAWRFSDTSWMEIYIGTPSGGNVSAGETDKYESDPNRYHDLIIKAAKMTLAGVYVCLVRDINDDTDRRFLDLTVAEKSKCIIKREVKLEVGEWITLECSVQFASSMNGPFMKWFDEENNEITRGRYVVSNIPEEVKIKPSSTYRPSRSVYRVKMNATADDDGKTFRCEVTIDDYHDFCEVTYTVKYPPTEVTFHPDYTEGDAPLKLVVGDHINCTAQGNPTPILNWKKLTIDGGGPQTYEGFQLVMEEDMANSTYEYECMATNIIDGQTSSASGRVKFDVRDPYPVADVTFHPDYTEGDPPLTLNVKEHINCAAQGYPKPTFIWRKQNLDSAGPKIVEDFQLEMVKDMLGSTNEYECTASNTIKGQTYTASRNVKFNVTNFFPVRDVTFYPKYADGDKPLTVKIGKYINCTAEGNPEPTYSWRNVSIDGGDIQTVQGSQLVMVEDMLGSTNEYECTASNTIKGQPYITSLNVKFDVTNFYPVRDLIFQPDYIGGTPLKLNVGDHINCTAQGNPEPTFRWEKQAGGGVRYVDGFQLAMTENMEGSTNIYNCQAMNSAENWTQSLTRTVKFYVGDIPPVGAGSFKTFSLAVLLISVMVSISKALGMN